MLPEQGVFSVVFTDIAVKRFRSAVGVFVDKSGVFKRRGKILYLLACGNGDLIYIYYVSACRYGDLDIPLFEVDIFKGGVFKFSRPRKAEIADGITVDGKRVFCRRIRCRRNGNVIVLRVGKLKGEYPAVLLGFKSGNISLAFITAALF